jgi:DNA-binding IscR family transcriptional regulator
VTTVALELVRFLLALYVAWLYRGTFDLIYGTMGLVVVFLIALELMWLVILLGVEVSYVHQNLAEIVRSEAHGSTDAPSFDLYFGLLVAVEVCLAHRRREPAPRGDAIARRVAAPRVQVDALLDRLEQGGYVTRAGSDGDGWLPACDPGAVKLRELVDTLEEGGRRRVPNALTRQAGAGDRAVSSLLESLDAGLASASGERTLGQLVDDVMGATVPAAGIPAGAQ